jgi:hypothetical protein
VESIIEKLVTILFSGGPQAISAFLLLVVGLLFLERQRLLKELTKKDDKIDKIIDDYYQGNMTLTEALNSLKFVLYEIKGKL